MHVRAGETANNGSVSPDEVSVIPRAEFLRAWGNDYAPGQHVTMLGPTQRGKTTLGLQLLDKVITPTHEATIFAGKPPKRDAVMGNAAKALNLRIVETWPPPFRTWADRKRRGFVLRPYQGMTDLKADEANLKEQYANALKDNYANATEARPRISFIDEAHHVQQDLGLKKEYEAPLLRGAPHNAVWSLLQRGRFSSYLTYDAPDHVFIFHDPDESNQKRYSEIGGVDPKMLIWLASTLKTYRTKSGRTISEAIYIRRAGPEICIVSVA